MLTSLIACFKSTVIFTLIAVICHPSWGQGFITDKDGAGNSEQTKEETPEQRIARLKIELLKAEIAALEAASGETSDKSNEAEPASNVGGQADIPKEALVVVESEFGGGSGFIAKIKGRMFFVTNIHVIGSAGEATFTTSQGQELTLPNNLFVSKDRDLAIIPIEWTGPYLDLSPSLVFNKISIGDPITVMGNSDGVGVVTKLNGEIRAIGPDELEVSAKFVPGNSGSPIVHDATGLVVGIVSHMKDLSVRTKWTKDSELSEIRRFGFRLDGDIEWKQLTLAEIYKQGEAYATFEDRTQVLAKTAYMLKNEKTVMTNYSSHSSLGYMFDTLGSDFSWQRGTSSANNILKLERFIKSIQNELVTDRQQTRDTLTVDFYKRRFVEMDRIRTHYLKELNRLEY